LHYQIHTRAGELFEVDFAWPELLLCVELDGWKDHGTRAAFAKDRARDRALFAEGWVVLRFTWEEIANSPDRVCLELQQAINSRLREISCRQAQGSEP
jgi:very-short-patch-repair endonuclease